MSRGGHVDKQLSGYAMPHVDAAARRAYAARYRAENPEKVKASAARYRAKHPEKLQVSQTRYRAANRKKVNAHSARYRAKNLEKQKARCARYYAKNAAKLRAYQKRRNGKNPEKKKAYQMAYRAANVEKAKAYSACYRPRYRAENPEKHRAHSAKRRAYKRSACGMGITARQWSDVLISTLGLCSYCNKRRLLTLDHIVPLFSGGEHDIDNAVPACNSCNSAKGKTPLVLWLARRAA